MSRIDWLVLAITLGAIILYGLYRSSTSKDMEGYFLSNRSMPWWLVLMSIMGTQASAITFLSAPGQAFTDGMRFVQYYFGLPLAMVLISISFVPVFNKLKVFTAYEYLEQRFDLKTRIFTSFLFLLSRGLSTGISIYAPSIIVSSLLGWDIYLTNVLMGGLLIVYTVGGGAKSIAYTQQLQLVIILGAMVVCGYTMVHKLPDGFGFADALHVSGAAGKLNAITTGFKGSSFDWKDKYNLVSGLVGGFFLALSYFGTDQSQVGRYLTAKDNKQSRMGLLMNGLVKVPMQFLILLLGALLFSYYQLNPAPLFFNDKAVAATVYTSPVGDSLRVIESAYAQESKLQRQSAISYLSLLHGTEGQAQYTPIKESIATSASKLTELRTTYKGLLHRADASIDVNDTNYIFLYFVVHTLPAGLVGLFVAVIFMASWGSIAAALNSLSSCTMVDFYCRLRKQENNNSGTANDGHKEYRLSRWVTFAWGVFCIIIAEFANRIGSLIEAVNVLGSLFYGVILGIFLVAFYIKKIGGNAVFIASIISEAIVICLFVLDKNGTIGLGFLWLNVAGAVAVVVLSVLMHLALPHRIAEQTAGISLNE